MLRQKWSAPRDKQIKKWQIKGFRKQPLHFADAQKHASGMMGDTNAQRYSAEMQHDTQALCIWYQIKIHLLKLQKSCRVKKICAAKNCVLYTKTKWPRL